MCHASGSRAKAGYDVMLLSSHWSAAHWQQWAPAFTHKKIHVLPEASQQGKRNNYCLVAVWNCVYSLLLTFWAHALHMAVLCMEWFMANLLVCELLKAFVRTDYVSTKASVDELSLQGLQCAVTVGHSVFVMWSVCSHCWCHGHSVFNMWSECSHCWPQCIHCIDHVIIYAAVA